MTDETKPNGSVTLCVVFNHPFPKNIPLLREMFKSRFSKVVFIQPIVQSPDEDVFTSARGSYNYSASICDFLLNNKIETDHIVFTQDDVLINPRINETNVGEWFHLDRYDAFLPHLRAMEGKMSDWLWFYQTFWRAAFPMSQIIGSGVEGWLRYLPDREEFSAKLKEQYGFEGGPIEFNINGVGSTWEHYVLPQMKETLGADFYRGLSSTVALGTKIDMPFPFCYGMSDFFVLRQDILGKFTEYLTVMSALQIFAEVAVPTALALASSKVAQQHDIGLDTRYLWGDVRNQIDTTALIAAYKDNLLLLHPIKPSSDADILDVVLGSFDV